MNYHTSCDIKSTLVADLHQVKHGFLTGTYAKASVFAMEREIEGERAVIVVGYNPSLRDREREKERKRERERDLSSRWYVIRADYSVFALWW